MIFFRTVRLCAIKSLPFLLAALATAFVLLFLPMLSQSKSEKQNSEVIFTPCPIKIAEMQTESDAQNTQAYEQTQAESHQLVPNFPQPSTPPPPPITPELQLSDATPIVPESLFALQDAEPLAANEDIPLIKPQQDNIGQQNNVGNEKAHSPIVLKKARPSYPERSRRLGIEGYVIVQFNVDENGNVKNASVQKAVPEGHFERVALNAIKKWRFKPAQNKEGKPITSKLQIKIDFTLNSNAEELY